VIACHISLCKNTKIAHYLIVFFLHRLVEREHGYGITTIAVGIAEATRVRTMVMDETRGTCINDIHFLQES
jgi:hypothetical protein